VPRAPRRRQLSSRHNQGQKGEVSTVKELIEMIVKGLVEEPDKVEVTQVEGERSIIFEVRVADEDMGRVIGKGGRIANSLRTLVKAAGARLNKNIWVDINKHSEQ
jgi:hypothetical protein